MITPSHRILLSLISAALFSLNIAQADFVQMGTSFGPETALEDTSANLLWLHLNFTNNHSFDDVTANLAADGSYSGWRFATPDELAQFFGDYDHGVVDDAVALQFMNDLGGPLVNVFFPDNGFMRQSSTGLLDIPFGLGHASYGYIAVDNFFGASINPTLQGSALDSFGDASFGSWLVQSAVPEPGGLLLSLAGLVLLLLLGRNPHFPKTTRSHEASKDRH